MPSLNSKIVEIDGLGKVLIERSAKAKHIGICIKPFKGIRVAVPQKVTFDYALKALRAKEKWILSRILKIKILEKNYDILVNKSPKLNKAAAKEMLKNRLKLLSVKHGIEYNRVFVKNQKTRWGSCSDKKNINLNIQLARIPSDLIDYVIMHELAHISVKNHSAQFWEHLGMYIENPKKLDKKLKEYDVLLLGEFRRK